MPATGLRERLGGEGTMVVGEGYLLEMERRGYLQAGGFVPEVVIDHPQQVESLHREMVHAGSDVVLAFTYYGHREKLRLVGREDCLEELNRKALQMARRVANETGTLMAGNICNTTVFQRGNQEAIEKTEAMFKEQIGWAVEEGADYIVGETFMEFAEAELALQSIKKYGNGLPAVVTMAPMPTDRLFDDVPVGEACRRLEQGGADVVGLNCNRGPATMLPLMRQVRQACKGPIACMPVGYNTTPEHPTMHLLIDPFTGERAFPSELTAHLCGPAQVEHFAKEAKNIGVQYIGLCCGGSSICLRKVAEVYGRKPPASRFTPDMSKHFVFGKSSKEQGDYYKSGLKGIMSASAQ